MHSDNFQKTQTADFMPSQAWGGGGGGKENLQADFRAHT